MKRLLFLLFATLVAALYALRPPPYPVSAEAPLPQTGDYACILTSDVFFYSAADEQRGVFLLPRSYYVRLLDYGNDYCRVEYLTDANDARRLCGYAKTNELAFVPYAPKTPYLTYSFDLKYRVDEGDIASSDFLTEITLACTYYGDYLVGSKTYCYVLRGGEFGYVPKPSNLVYPENTEYAEYLSSLSSSEEDSLGDTNTQPRSVAQVAVLIAVCLLVPLLAALLFKSSKRPPYDFDA